MKNLNDFENFVNSDPHLSEAAGISPAIYKDLQSYFKTSKKPSLQGAQSFISRIKKDWKLSAEDFEEAKRHFSE